MTFGQKIEALKCMYSSGNNQKIDGAVLCGINGDAIPIAEHIVFDPMPELVISDLLDCYKGQFPVELLKLYSEMNGAILFCGTRKVEFHKKAVYVPTNKLSIYGVPLTFDRKHIEPYSIKVEDLNRHEEVPAHWLKFGHYTEPNYTYERLDLFVDTCTNRVYATEHGARDFKIIDNWDGIDSSLCQIFDMITI